MDVPAPILPPELERPCGSSTAVSSTSRRRNALGRQRRHPWEECNPQLSQSSPTETFTAVESSRISSKILPKVRESKGGRFLRELGGMSSKHSLALGTALKSGARSKIWLREEGLPASGTCRTTTTSECSSRDGPEESTFVNYRTSSSGMDLGEPGPEKILKQLCHENAPQVLPRRLCL